MKLSNTFLAAVAVLLTLAVCLAVLDARATLDALPDPLEAGWQGEPVCEKLHDDEDLRVLRCTFPPTVGHERHYHDKHFGYALSGGRMRITDATGVRDVDLPTGSSYASDGTEWHEVVNVGDSTVTYLIVEPR
ncbi:MAG: cupin domain-containing protein [Pseudomonadota bacterium]